MDSLVGKQGEARSERQKTLESVKRLQESVQLKIKDIQSQRSKMPFKSIEEVESRIAVLEKSIESGTLKLIDEKKALHEISTLRRSKNALNGLNTVEVAIAEDRARIDELKKVLDDPETKKKMAKYEELKKELDDLKQQGNKVYEERNALYDERNALQKQMDELYDRKREVSQTYRDKNDAYYAKVAEERKAKQDRFRAEKQEEEAAKRKEDIARMREDAQSPAFAAEIEDTGVLIGWFQGKYGDASSAKVPQTHAGANASADKAVLEGVKKLEIRKVDQAPMDGMVLKKKGGEDEESFFMGGGSGKKGKKGSKQAGAATTSPKASSTPTPSEPSAAATTNTAINLPMGLLTALLSLGISPPTNKDDTTRVIADLEHKRDWFLANQEKKTKEEVARVEKVIAKMEKKGKQQEQSGDEPEILDEVEEAKEQGIKEPVHSESLSSITVFLGLSPHFDRG